MSPRNRIEYEATLDAIAASVALGFPFVLWGDPGSGKTAVIESIAESDIHVEVLVCSHFEPSDFGGLPVVGENGSVTMAPAEWAVRVDREPRRSLIFLEEFSVPRQGVGRISAC